MLQEIETERTQLEAKGLKLNMNYIQKLAKDEASLTQSITVLKTWIPHLEKLRKSHRTALKSRWAIRSKIYSTRDAFARASTQALKSALTDLNVSLKYTESGYSPSAADIIVKAMGWRTISVRKADILLEKLGLPALLEAIERNNYKAISNIETKDGIKFSDQEANLIIERLSESHIIFQLSTREVGDIPRLTVTKKVNDENGDAQILKREFSKLSLGQQQSVLLALMLCSKKNTPLIIDQPEDNLDSEFIYHSLVPALRGAKERRQIIIVTHNANIAVLGDAEQIIVLKSNNEQGKIVSSGSIDDVATREYSCNILEGAKDAFKRRAVVYGIE